MTTATLIAVYCVTPACRMQERHTPIGYREDARARGAWWCGECRRFTNT